MTSTTQPTAATGTETVRYTAYGVYARIADQETPAEDLAAELSGLVQSWAADDVVVRGFYDLSAFRADADLLVWWHAPTAEAIQRAARDLRRSALGHTLSPTWSAVGVHRQAEFNRAHIPAFLAGAAPKAWVSVYPFVRSYQWYLLPEGERRDMLAEHGLMGREHPEVLSNTVAAFALGDYEWLLALEADQVHETVDLMRHLRAAAARGHVREEVPFFTGRRVDAAGAVEALR